MKAIVRERYGGPDVLELREVPLPVVKDDQVLVRVRAASANPYDWHYLRGLPYAMRLMGSGVRSPKDSILGSDVAGHVEAVGPRVTHFRPGDDVYGSVVMGAFAEYACGAESALHRKPHNLTFEQAATVPMAGLTALQGLRDTARVQPRHKVLIIGASGGVGTFAVQIAKHLGAEVSGVCSTRNVERVRALGADHVIDYTQTDFTRAGNRYDVIFQVAGTQSPAACRRALTPSGTLVLCSGDSPGRWLGAIDRILQALALSPFVGQRLKPLVATWSGQDLHVLTELIEAGTVTPVIDTTYPLGDVAEAIRYVETGHARGKVVISVCGTGAGQERQGAQAVVSC